MCIKAVAFFIGYLLQDIKLFLWIGVGGTALVFLAVVPPWPFYNQHPLKWLPAGRGGSTTSVPHNLVIDGKLLR